MFICPFFFFLLTKQTSKEVKTKVGLLKAVNLLCTASEDTASESTDSFVARKGIHQQNEACFCGGVHSSGGRLCELCCLRAGIWRGCASCCDDCEGRFARLQRLGDAARSSVPSHHKRPVGSVGSWLSNTQLSVWRQFHHQKSWNAGTIYDSPPRPRALSLQRQPGSDCIQR